MDTILLGAALLVSGYYITQDSRNARGAKKGGLSKYDETVGDNIYSSNEYEKQKKALQDVMDARFKDAETYGTTLVFPDDTGPEFPLYSAPANRGEYIREEFTQGTVGKPTPFLPVRSLSPLNIVGGKQEVEAEQLGDGIGVYEKKNTGYENMRVTTLSGIENGVNPFLESGDVPINSGPQAADLFYRQESRTNETTGQRDGRKAIFTMNSSYTNYTRTSDEGHRTADKTQKSLSPIVTAPFRKMGADTESESTYKGRESTRGRLGNPVLGNVRFNANAPESATPVKKPFFFSSHAVFKPAHVVDNVNHISEIDLKSTQRGRRTEYLPVPTTGVTKRDMPVETARHAPIAREIEGNIFGSLARPAADPVPKETYSRHYTKEIKGRLPNVYDRSFTPLDAYSAESEKPPKTMFQEEDTRLEVENSILQEQYADVLYLPHKKH